MYRCRTMPLTKERIDDIFREISGYKIELQPDPTVLGAKYLQEQIALCRNYTNNVAQHVNRIHRERMNIDSVLRRKEAAFRIASDELLSNNAQVRNLPNIADRQAQININLRDEHRDIEELKNDVRDLDHLEKMIKLVHRELKDTMAEIKLQRSLVRDELDSGRMYGDERNSAYTGEGKAEKPMLDDLDEEEINRLMRGDSAEESTQDATPSDPVTQEENSTSDAEKIDHFLNDSSETQPVVVPESAPTTKATSTDDFSDFLDGV